MRKMAKRNFRDRVAKKADRSNIASAKSYNPKDFLGVYSDQDTQHAEELYDLISAIKNGSDTVEGILDTLKTSEPHTYQKWGLDPQNATLDDLIRQAFIHPIDSDRELIKSERCKDVFKMGSMLCLAPHAEYIPTIVSALVEAFGKDNVTDWIDRGLAAIKTEKQVMNFPGKKDASVQALDAAMNSEVMQKAIIQLQSQRQKLGTTGQSMAGAVGGEYMPGKRVTPGVNGRVER